MTSSVTHHETTTAHPQASSKPCLSDGDTEDDDKGRSSGLELKELVVVVGLVCSILFHNSCHLTMQFPLHYTATSMLAFDGLRQRRTIRPTSFFKDTDDTI